MSMRHPAVPRRVAMVLLLAGTPSAAALSPGVPRPALPPPGQTDEGPRLVAERVLASELDSALPEIPIADWLRATVRADAGMQWTQTACPATHERLDDSPAKWPVCVLIATGRSARRGPERPLGAGNGELVVAVSIRLGTGNATAGAWQRQRPEVEDAFIERDGDSLTVTRLRDLPGLLQLKPEEWPKSELSVSPGDLRCDKAMPAPGETVKCQVVVRNSGPIDAFARVHAGIATHGSDMGLGKSLPLQNVPADGRVVVAWDWVWPEGRRWHVMVSVELHTPHAYGGYRLPIRERNVGDNRASVAFGRDGKV